MRKQPRIRSRTRTTPLVSFAACAPDDMPDRRGPWQTQYGAPWVDTRKRIGSLPKNVERAVALHEMAHVHLTPDKTPDEWAAEIGEGVTGFDVNAAEDCRVNRWLFERQGVSAAELHESFERMLSTKAAEEKIRALFKAEETAMVVGLLVAGADSHPELLNPRKYRGPLRKIVTATRNEIRVAYRGYHNDERFTARLARHIASYRPPPHPPEADVGPDAPPDADVAETINHDGQPWGTMNVVHPPLTEATTTLRAGYRPTAEARSAIHFPHRWKPWQGQYDVFRRKARRLPAMSVLLDASGSMYIGDAALAALLRYAPASVIGAYGGCQPNTGALAVLAMDGRRTTLSRSELRALGVGGCNIVDVPALQWLAKQPKPRYWVCDGAVTGYNDRPNLEVTKTVHMLQQRHKITRHDNIETLLTHLGIKYEEE